MLGQDQAIACVSFAEGELHGPQVDFHQFTSRTGLLFKAKVKCLKTSKWLLLPWYQALNFVNLNGTDKNSSRAGCWGLIKSSYNSWFISKVPPLFTQWRFPKWGQSAPKGYYIFLVFACENQSMNVTAQQHSWAYCYIYHSVAFRFRVQLTTLK